jgi:hypothetical protein
MTHFREKSFDTDRGYAVFSNEDGKQEAIVHRGTYETCGVPFRPMGSDRYAFEPGTRFGIDPATGVERFIAERITLQKN